MRKPPLHRPSGRRAAYLACLGAVLCGCDHDRLAGTSVGTGNPGVVTLGFTDGSAAVRVSGRVSLYAADHNPLVDSLPLASYAVEDRDSLELDQESLLPRLRRPDFGSDSDFSVNVLLRTGDGRGAWQGDLGLVLRAGRLQALRPERRVELDVVPLDSFRGDVTGQELPQEKRYLTVFGSPFFGRVSGGAFSLDSIPRGRYVARLVRLLPDAPAAGDARPAPVHALADALYTQGTGPLSPLLPAIDTVSLPLEGPREGP
jgi:hypothetical protein